MPWLRGKVERFVAMYVLVKYENADRKGGKYVLSSR